MINKWRWDQGRLGYFQFDNIQRIASVLYELDGVELNQKDFDPLRSPLENGTGLPFSPTTYKVWRNYKRVFECSFLATRINDRLFITDFCKKLAIQRREYFDVDQYLSALVPRFRFPFAAFDDYSSNVPIVYPFITLLKYLISQFVNGRTATLTLETVFRKIIGNKCDGTEGLNHYADLPLTNYFPTSDESRQVREMLIFISQLSILKWHKGELILDVLAQDLQEYEDFKFLTDPVVTIPAQIREEDYLKTTSLEQQESTRIWELHSRESPIDNLFFEGKKSRVIHIKIERSPILRKLFLAKNPTPICDMCVADMKVRYPWTDNILEIHHILPLSSSLPVTKEGTSLEDLVGLCPNCHRSVHGYYKDWLNTNLVEDFESKYQAKTVYEEAKQNIRL